MDVVGFNRETMEKLYMFVGNCSDVGENSDFNSVWGNFIVIYSTLKCGVELRFCKGENILYDFPLPMLAAQVLI